MRKKKCLWIYCHLSKFGKHWQTAEVRSQTVGIKGYKYCWQDVGQEERNRALWSINPGEKKARETKREWETESWRERERKSSLFKCCSQRHSHFSTASIRNHQNHHTLWLCSDLVLKYQSLIAGVNINHLIRTFRPFIEKLRPVAFGNFFLLYI